MLNWLLELIFGCNHQRTTFPITAFDAKGKGAYTYVACLDCGRRYEYSWVQMRRGKELAR